MAKKARVKKKAAVKKPPARAKQAAPAKAVAAKKSAGAKKPSAPVQPSASPASLAGVPAGQHTVTPRMVVRGASHAIEFYRRAFGAREVMRVPSPDGFGIMHAEIAIGDSRVYLSDEMPSLGKSPQSLGGTACTIHLYVADADKVFQQAVEAGATAIQPPADMFWGDRYGKLLDPFGHEWAIATHKEDVPPAEMEKRFQAALAKGGQEGPR